MISKFKIFESKSDIDAICARYDITNYTINDDLSISVDGDVDFYQKPKSGSRQYVSSGGPTSIDKIPLKFKEVSGDFHCYIANLKSLKGCPEKVGGDFKCFNNQLESLEFCPREVGGLFNCSNNSLESLEFCPKEIGGDFNCYGNLIKSLKGCPEKVGGGDFDCSNNRLESLEFCPQSISYLSCASNKLKSLEYLPKDIKEIYCYDNNITSFDGLPEFFDSDIDLSGNPVYEIYKLFNKDPKCIDYIREFDVIQGNKIIKDRLEEVYVHMGMEMPRDIKYRLCNYPNSIYTLI